MTAPLALGNSYSISQNVSIVGASKRVKRARSVEAVRNSKVVGLALDEDNQSALTKECIKTWVAQLKQEFSL